MVAVLSRNGGRQTCDELRHGLTCNQFTKALGKRGKMMALVCQQGCAHNWRPDHRQRRLRTRLWITATSRRPVGSLAGHPPIRPMARTGIPRKVESRSTHCCCNCRRWHQDERIDAALSDQPPRPPRSCRTQSWRPVLPCLGQAWPGAATVCSGRSSPWNVTFSGWPELRWSCGPLA